MSKRWRGLLRGLRRGASRAGLGGFAVGARGIAPEGALRFAPSASRCAPDASHLSPRGAMPLAPTAADCLPQAPTASTTCPEL